MRVNAHPRKNLWKRKRRGKKKQPAPIIKNKVFLRQTVSPYDDAGRSSAIDRAASNYNDAKDKVKKKKKKIEN